MRFSFLLPAILMASACDQPKAAVGVPSDGAVLNSQSGSTGLAGVQRIALPLTHGPEQHQVLRDYLDICSAAAVNAMAGRRKAEELNWQQRTRGVDDPSDKIGEWVYRPSIDGIPVEVRDESTGATTEFNSIDLTLRSWETPAVSQTLCVMQTGRLTDDFGIGLTDLGELANIPGLEVAERDLTAGSRGVDSEKTLILGAGLGPDGQVLSLMVTETNLSRESEPRYLIRISARVNRPVPAGAPKLQVPPTTSPPSIIVSEFLDICSRGMMDLSAASERAVAVGWKQDDSMPAGGSVFTSSLGGIRAFLLLEDFTYSSFISRNCSVSLNPRSAGFPDDPQFEAIGSIEGLSGTYVDSGIRDMSLSDRQVGAWSGQLPSGEIVNVTLDHRRAFSTSLSMVTYIPR